VRAAAAAARVGLALAVALGLAACHREHTWEVMAVSAPGHPRTAFIRGRSCHAGPCQSLWIGDSREGAIEFAALEPGRERCDEIAWTPDGSRVAFLINGYQLRLYDPKTLSPAGQIRLIEPDGEPSTRIARGVTFSENGRAVTFDDCPRGRSGCRSGLVAVPR
jgi:hypothetical protein